MNKLLRKSVGIFLLSSFYASLVWGVPAKPGLVVYKQPDGTELKVRLVGDEFHHYYLSEDGYLLLENSADYLCYASLQSDGIVTASDFKAMNIATRSEADNRFLAVQDGSRILKTYQTKAIKEASMKRTAANRMRTSNPYPTTGKQKVLVLLVEFADVPFTTADAKNAFSRMLHEEGYSDNGATGSARDYYIASSNGQYEPEIDMYGPVKLPNKMAYYGGNDMRGQDKNPAQMVVDACKLLDDEIDFSQYDLDKDGAVDNIYVFYAGYGEADGGGPNTVWPHAFYVKQGAMMDVKCDGVYIDRYACSNEIVKTTDKMTGIGTFCHEFGHVLGLPDLYATDYSNEQHPGDWDIMASGSYSNNGNTPPMMSAYERYFLDWLDPIEIKQTDTTFVLPPLVENKAYRISTENPDEYFLFENRQQTGWDSFIPGHGMLVWHIDYDYWIWFQNAPNNDVNHQRIDIEEADGISTSMSASGDAFPGTSNATSITDKTIPNLKAWNGKDSGMGIYNIYETSDSLIIFDVIDLKGTLDDVKGCKATDVTPVSFRANWEKVADATAYVIDVYKQSGSAQAGSKDYVNGYVAYHVGNELSCEVTGLEPETDYYFRVRARGSKYIGGYSTPVKVHTGDKDYRFFAPEVAAPTSVTDCSFVANWNSLADTKNYYVSVFEVGHNEVTEEVCDFSKGSSIPNGWKSSSYSWSDKEGYYGKEPNSLVMKRTNGFIYSPIKEEMVVKSFSFWYRGAADMPEDNRLRIYGYMQNGWELIREINPLTKEAGGDVVSMDLEQFDELFHAVKIVYERPQMGSIHLDDIKVEYFKPTLTPLVGFEKKDVGNSLSVKVTDLRPTTFYAYQVKGYNGVLESENSSIYYLKTLQEGTSIIEKEEHHQVYAYVTDGKLVVKGIAAGISVTVCDVSGRMIAQEVSAGNDIRINLPADGLYIVRMGDFTLKVIR